MPKKIEMQFDNERHTKVVQVELEYEDEIVLICPDGQKISVVLSYQEPGEQLPELDIMLPADMTANCWLEGLVPSISDPEYPSALKVRQICIPIEPKGTP